MNRQLLPLSYRPARLFAPFAGGIVCVGRSPRLRSVERIAVAYLFVRVDRTARYQEDERVAHAVRRS